MDWISVEDEEPKKHHLVWVIWNYEGKNIYTLAEWDGYDFCRLQPAYEYQVIDDYAVDSYGGKVTHWTHLREPPKE